MKKLGQHFLKNPATLKKIANALSIGNGDRIIEIGPGHGELTTPLIMAAQEKQCSIICIEKDHSLIEALESIAMRENATDGERAGDAARMKIIEGDALRLLPSLISHDYKIVGNIPYYITGKLLRIMSELDQKPERVVLLIQKEVAERICAMPPAMNRLAASVQFWATATIVASVPRGDFSPPPEVDSAIIALDRIADNPLADPALYYRAVRAIFAQPRKTLLNNLLAGTADEATKSDIVLHLKNIGVNPGARPQDLSIRQIITISNIPIWG